MDTIEKAINYLKAQGVYPVIEAWKLLITDYYDSTKRDGSSKSSWRTDARETRFYFQNSGIIPRVSTMERHLKAAGITFIGDGFWHFQGKEDESGAN